MKTLDGRTAFITGGASGIGLGIARAFLAEGMRVCIADVDLENLALVDPELVADKSRLHLLRLNVADGAAMARAALEVQDRFGPVHLLCNNAGITAATRIEDADQAAWDTLMAINVGGVINGLVAFLPGMKAHGQGGHVVNTASMAAFIASPGISGLYSTSKFAVRGLTESLRLSLAAHSLGVSLLCPGPVETRILQSSAKRRIAAGEASGPPEVAALEGAMSPVAVGRRVVEGVKANAAYIFTHPGWKEELAKHFADILSALPPGDPPQDPFNQGRRARLEKARAAAAALE